MLKSKAAPLKDIVWSRTTPMVPNTNSTFHFREVQVNEVFKHLKRLSRNKTSGPDKLHAQRWYRSDMQATLSHDQHLHQNRNRF